MLHRRLNERMLHSPRPPRHSQPASTIHPPDRQRLALPPAARKQRSIESSMILALLRSVKRLDQIPNDSKIPAHSAGAPSIQEALEQEARNGFGVPGHLIIAPSATWPP